MRVIRRLRDQDDGASAVIFAISLFALFGIAALAVDAGQLWWNRRSLVVDTDAAALAAAGYAREQMVLSGVCAESGAADVAELLIVENEATTSFDKTDPAQFDLDCTTASTYGHVTVSATNETRYAFAGIFGNGDRTDVYARSHAEFGPLVSTDRLRPLPLCLEPGATTPYGAWKAGQTSGPLVVGAGNPGTIYRVEISREWQASHCNAASLPTEADFRWIDFDGERPQDNCDDEANGPELVVRFMDGYGCVVYTHQFDDGVNSGHNCRPDSGQFTNDNCPSQTGNVRDILKCVAPGLVPGQGGSSCQDQVCPMGTAATECDEKWTLLVYDQRIMAKPDGTACQPNGQGKYPGCEAEFHPAGFVTAVLRDAHHGGGVGDPSWLGLEFIRDATGQGAIGGPGVDASNLNVTGVRLCGAEDADNCKG